MTLDLVLSIIDQSLKLANTLAEDMTPEQRQQLWARHDARMERWERLVDKIDTGEKGAPTV